MRSPSEKTMTMTSGFSARRTLSAETMQELYVSELARDFQSARKRTGPQVHRLVIGLSFENQRSSKSLVQGALFVVSVATAGTKLASSRMQAAWQQMAGSLNSRLF